MVAQGLIALIIGLAWGLGGRLPTSRPMLLHAVEGVLWITLLLVGFELGARRDAWERLCASGWWAIGLPLAAAGASLTAALGVGWLWHLPPQEACAVGAGLGWYSLSGALLTRLHGPELGALAFLANIFRELLAILLMPALVKRLGDWPAIAAGGATTMDTTLPLLADLTGGRAVALALIHGFILSALVPVLVTWFGRSG